jgi:hypothetical protein
LKLSVGLVLAAISLLALVPLVQATSTTSSSSASSGYVTYSVQATYNGTSRAASVTENVAPDSTLGDSIIQLTVEGTMSNFTYSHVVNSSLTMFPYLPAISNENYSYTRNSTTVTAEISQHGTSQVTFKGTAYTLSDYAFSAQVTSTNGTDTIAGTVSAFPSDLVYSVTAQRLDVDGRTDGAATSGSVSATLTATSLALSTGAAGLPLQAASAGMGLSLA